MKVTNESDLLVSAIVLTLALGFWSLQLRLMRTAGTPLGGKRAKRAALLLILLSLLGFPFALYLLALGFTVWSYGMPAAALMVASAIGGLAIGVDLMART